MASFLASQLRAAPNQLTLLRLIFIPFVAIAILDRRYRLALVLFVLAGASDLLDGLLARWLKQRTVLGQYLDPIADKLLLSTLFLVLSSVHRIPWPVTVLVFTRDVSILAVSVVLYITGAMRDLAPSLFGKANTAAQLLTIFVVLLHLAYGGFWLDAARQVCFWITMTFTLLSGIHYILRVGWRLRAAAPPPSSPS
jgi:cardiolipin synthase